MVPPIQSKLPQVGTTIFTEMSALAAEQKAINLGQGFPDFPMSPELISLVNDAMLKGYNQYTPMQGFMPLRESIAEKIEYLYGTKINPDTQVTITPGGTYAIYTALTTLLQPGDEVIVFEPAYDSYIPNIEVNGAVAVRINLEFPGYQINWEEVRKKIGPKTKMIMLNSPNNPTGSVLSGADIAELRDIVATHPLFISSDEVYEHLIYDGLPHQSMLRYPDLLERSFVSFSFGKVYNCTGWKIGYSVSSPALMHEFRKVHQFNCFSCNSPVQIALSAFLRKRDSYLLLAETMQSKRDYFAQLLSTSRFVPLASHGSYFQCYVYDRISDEKDRDFAIRLTREYGVASIPVSAFYKEGTDHHVLRFCFSKKEETLEEAANRLLKV